jgi:hypothetical protein
MGQTAPPPSAALELAAANQIGDRSVLRFWVLFVAAVVGRTTEPQVSDGRLIGRGRSTDGTRPGTGELKDGPRRMVPADRKLLLLPGLDQDAGRGTGSPRWPG